MVEKKRSKLFAKISGQLTSEGRDIIKCLSYFAQEQTNEIVFMLFKEYDMLFLINTLILAINLSHI